MDKAEYRAKLDEINALADAGDYEGAAKAVDEVDWRRVKSVRTLCMVGEIYEVNGRLDDSRRVLEIAYKRSPDSKTVIYRLADLCIRLGDFDAALDYFTEFSEISPTDCSKYILKYKLYRARKSPIEDQIAILEQYKEGEFTERWAYELARLYSQAGNKEKCIEVCDDIILWFGEGKYVTKAMELKMQYTPLSPSQQVKYQESMQKIRAVSRMDISAKASSVYPDEDDDQQDGSGYAAQAIEKMNTAASAAVSEELVLKVPNAGSLNMSKMSDPAQMQSQLADSIRQVFSGLNQRGSVQEDENLAFAEEEEIKVYKPLKEDLSRLKIKELEPEQLGAEEVPVAGMARAIVETAPVDDEQIAGQMSLMDFAKPEEELDLDALFAETSNILAQEVATGAFVKTDDSLESKLAAEDAAVRKAAEEEVARKAAEEEAARKAAEEEAVRKAVAEEEAARKAAEEEAVRKAAEEEAARKAAEEEAARKAAEEEEAARKAAEEEVARKAAEEEAARKAAEEEAVRKAVAEEEAACKVAEEEEAARKAAEEEAARKAAEEEAVRKAAEEEAARKVAEEQISYEKETDESLGITRQFNFQEELKKAQQTEEELFAAELAKSVAELKMEDAEEIQLEIQEDFADDLSQPVEEEEVSIKESIENPSVLIEEITEENAALAKEAVKDNFASAAPVSGNDEFADLEKALMSISFEEEETVQEQDSVPEEEKVSEEALDDLEDFMIPVDEPKRLSFLPVEPRPFNEDEKKIFTYFTTIPGMSQQITEALADVHNNAGDKTSRSGNILLIGRQGSGKTRLCDAIVLAICKDLDIEAAKVAKVIGRDFNRKDPAAVVSKLSGGFLIIEGAGEMTKDTAGKLSQAMEFRTDSLVVMLEDEKMDLKNMLAKNPELAEKFTSSITIPVFTNDELVTFAKTYANECGYKMDEMGILALYTMIGDNQKDAEPITVAKVKAMVDKAIERANKGTRKFGRKLSKKATDDDNLIILYEKDFDFDIN